jgi:hypothetical protein
MQAWLRQSCQRVIKDCLLLTEAWLTLAWIDWVIQKRPYSRWQHWLEFKPKVTTADRTQVADVGRLLHLVERVSRHHLRPMNCLRRTLAQQRMLQRRHVPSYIHIGVRKRNNALEALSWLTLEGKILNDSHDVCERYAELKKDQWGNILNQ